MRCYDYSKLIKEIENLINCGDPAAQTNSEMLRLLKEAVKAINELVWYSGILRDDILTKYRIISMIHSLITLNDRCDHAIASTDEKDRMRILDDLNKQYKMPI